MNAKRYLIGSLAVFVSFFLTDLLLHEVLLNECYEAISHILRADFNPAVFFLWVILAELILAFGICFIFVKGYENRGIGEGIRFGFIIGITFSVTATIIQYAIFPIHAAFALSLAGGQLVQMVIAGIIIAAVYRPPAKGAAS